MAKKKRVSRTKKAETGRFRKWFVIFRRAVLWFFVVTILWVIIYRFVNPPVTWLMAQRGIERKFDGKDWTIDKKWKDFDEISNNLKYAAIAGEDANFMKHFGFDVNSIQKAYARNKSGKPVRGGSTISQQTAKNVFLWPGRSWVRKGFEAYFTLLIEIFWSKERILEVYLNVAEMGDGIYGAEAATQAFYNKSCAKLSKRQAALLIAILPAPLRWSPAHPTKYVYFKQYVILRNMRQVGKVKFD